jgi:hypothetical protein
MPFTIEQSAANLFWQALATGAMMPMHVADTDFAILDGRAGAKEIAQFVHICSAR